MLAHVGAYSAYVTPGRVNQFTCAVRQCVALAPRAQSASHLGSENRRGAICGVGVSLSCSASPLAIFEQAALRYFAAAFGC